MEMIKANTARLNTEAAITALNCKIANAVELAVKDIIMPAIDEACKDRQYSVGVYVNEDSVLDTYKGRVIIILQDLGYTVTFKVVPSTSEIYYDIRW